MTARRKNDDSHTPRGPDRVLLFADSLHDQRAVETEERQELETWVTCLLEEGLFGLPVTHVQEILRVADITRVPHAPFPVRGVTNMRGHVLPVVDLRTRLNLPPTAELSTQSRILVASSRGRLVGLLVDSVEQVLAIDRLRVEKVPDDVMTEQSRYLSGVYHHSDALLLLLDVDEVLQVHDGDLPS